MKQKCQYEKVCRVKKLYTDLCYLNMTEEQKRAVGFECVFEREYQKICPTGLMRKIIRDGSIKGKKL